MTGAAVSEARTESLLHDLVMLTKPRIISLLLVTTVAPMFVAGRPSLLLVVLVTIGGYLMAGGANAVNMYIDRDIDDRMARTRLRPIPSGRMDPRAVLAFGVMLATAATALFAFTVNVLTAALALLKQHDYGRAGVPMAPLVWGERETMWQMLWYTMILVPLTLLPVAFGAFGIIYFVSATVLGCILFAGIVKIMRAAQWTASAWKLYKFSLLYLALLFLAMAIDRGVFR